MKKIVILMVSLIFIFASFSFPEEEARLLRFPAVYENQVVFSYAGDLYTVGTDGGVARKLTNHSGYEMFPRFSPDGKWIAFTAQYDGNTEVYLMDSRGGVPKRLTYTATLGRDDVSDRMGPNNLVMGWKHDNKHIVFRSRMIEPNSFNGQLYLTTVEGDLHRQLPLPRGGFCSFSPDDSKLAYNRIFREFRTWKRYRGGMADDIWIYDFKTKKIKNITTNPAQDIIPMWKGDFIYFLSDRGPNKRMNLYVYNITSGETKRLTEFKEYDIKFPSLGNEAIAFENGGYIYLFNTKSQELKKLEIQIREDRLNARGGIRKVKKNIYNYNIAPDGKRALFVARGEVFTVPTKHGNTRNLTNTPGVHERNAEWSPDGKWIAFVSDQTGEDEIYIMPQDGGAKPTQLTTGADTYKYEILWSPDSKKILWGDKKLRLRYVDIDTKKIIDIVQAKYWEMRDFTWSPDSKWVAYSKQEATGFDKIFLYSLENGSSYPVTDSWYDSDDPTFSSDGKYLFFVSDRDYNPSLGYMDFSHIFRDLEKVYLVTLAKVTPSPFKPKSDEVSMSSPEVEKDKKGKEEKEKGKGKKKPAEVSPVKIDVDGIVDRIIALPINASGYGNPVCIKDKVYYLRRGTKDTETSLMMYDLEKRKETQLGGVWGFVISADLKKMLVSKDRAYYIIDLPTAKIQLKESLNLDNMEMKLCLKCEWKNIFHECWRHMRDFFYVANMHGVDWKKMRERYEPLLKHVNHRNDLTYIIGEMIGELNIGHTYVGGGERPPVEKIKTGLLGAKLERDPKTGFYQIKKILKGQNWDNSLVSPFTVMGVDAAEGDYIISVNGKSTAKMKNIYSDLINTVGKQVQLKLNSTPAETGCRNVVVVPIEDEHPLYYYNWVYENIRKVEKATNGKVGYLHIPDMGFRGLSMFSKLFYPQIRKKALIIDVRGNGGGFVSELIIEKLRREIYMIDIARNTAPSTNPENMVYGPKVCLLDEFSASDGDIFPSRFKTYKLGKLIGKRTWGGVVGIRGTQPLLDGGFIFKPEYASYDPEGKTWPIEGVGVEPDIYVDNDPAKEFAGIDEQLNKAIEVILEELKTKEKQIPPPPPPPDKSVKKK